MKQKRWILVALDIAVIPLALLLANFFRAGIADPAAVVWENWQLSITLMVIGAMLSLFLGLPRIRLNGFETNGVHLACLYAVLIALVGASLNSIAAQAHPWSTFVNFGLIVFIGVVGSRVLLRQVLLGILSRRHPRTAVVIYGAGRTGIQLANALRHDAFLVPVGFVDDNPALRRVYVSGMPVWSPIDLPRVIREKSVTKVLLAMPSLSAVKRSRIHRQLDPLGVDVQALPSFAQLTGEEPLPAKLAPVSPSDFLQRKSFQSDMSLARPTFAGRTVMVTGAGGSIGSELCRQLLALRPRRLVMVDSSELALYSIDMELRGINTGVELVPVLGSVTDESLCRAVMVGNGVEILLHAAAYKHVPLVETNPLAGLRNNVLGTKALAEAARDAGVERFILVSSDKAVRPANVMGASKRLSELIVQDMATRPGPLFSMVRFGNVLGSSGSVIPLFQDQIANGGPVTLTHEAVTRYFMTIDEAARLLLISCALTSGGDVFVLDMGKPVAIIDLARQMIEAAGYTVRDAAHPEGEIEIVVTGLRPGEKLHEELLIGEGRMLTEHAKITRARESSLSEIEVATFLRDLRDAIETNDTEAARAVLSRWVEGSMGSTSQRHA
ncbi:polysaccharide biosynthesis protein [Mangrovicoccus algicola]|uniref:Polysaccharide biosynthesis protein n=1 Tax=Mangrovicoccus algicola TaxID=2771008 RepID=A0A8J6YWF5_9RHOB|nr:nucleoside-diphosphate sugar epimerase/dehydratase [Mangrovicoccus algicola]MBE3639002.1 polysaccharide biosynthesis protein [Mangrovicoccus algicola]